MSRLPTLSPSRITTFLACPVKYRWTYVDDRGKWYVRAKSYYSFGATLHKVLERFHDSGDSGVSTTDEALAAYEESWVDAGFSSAEEMQEAFGEGKQILERYVAETLTKARAAKTLYVERLLGMDMGAFRLIGRVDRVDEHEDGTLEVIDYKSGRHEVEPEDVQTDIAMGVYTLLLKRMHSDREVVATLVAIRSGKQASYVMNEQELEEFQRDIQLIGDDILSSDWHEFYPTFKPICRACDFLPLCRKHEEFTG